MRKNIIFLFSFLMLIGCSKSEQSDIIPSDDPNQQPGIVKEELSVSKPIYLEIEEKNILEEVKDFGFSILQNGVPADARNPLVSPLSCSYGLAMLANGMNEESVKELLNAVAGADATLDDWNRMNHTLTTEFLVLDPTSVVKISNSVWGNTSIAFETAFSGEMEKWYGATCNNVDMTSAASAEAINSWINSATEGLIPSLFDNAPGEAAYLINALYFSGKWTMPFDKSLTEKKDFHNTDGSVADVDFMNGVFEDILFAETADYKAMCLPLGNLGFNFYAILPREGKNLPLSLAEWYEVRNKMGSYDEVTVSLPKFKTEFEEVNVKEVLKAKGVKKLFDDANSLERLCSPMIDPSTLTFLHKSVFGIDESGAEGASEFVTGMDLAVIGGSGEPAGPKIGEIKLNRPFLYLIEERSTHALLFIGVINDLQK